MLKKIFLLMLVVLLAACATERPRAPRQTQPVPAPQPGDTKSVSVNSFEQKIIDATNAFRAQNGLGALKPTVQLLVVAQNHARNMARQDRFGDSDHNGHVLDGRSFEDRIAVSGYPFARAAENVGYQLNKGDAAGAMMDGWKHSSGHRRNMLTPEITEIGVGAAQGKSGRWYFVQVFGLPRVK